MLNILNNLFKKIKRSDDIILKSKILNDRLK